MSDFIEKIIRKIFSIIVNTGMTVFGIIFMLAGLGGFVTSQIWVGVLFLVLGVGMTAFGTRWFWLPGFKQKRQEAQKLKNIKAVTLENSAGAAVSDFAQECYDKAASDYNKLNDVIRNMQDAELSAQLQKMQGIANKMISYMQKHPDRITLAEHFINYYQDRAVSLSTQFVEFEQMQVTTPEINEIKAKTKQTLAAFDEAYEAQFSNMLSNKVLELESELKLAEQLMSDAGIKNENPAPKAADNTPAISPKSYTSGSSNESHSQMPFAIEHPFDIKPAEPEPCQAKGRGNCHNRPRGRFQR